MKISSFVFLAIVGIVFAGAGCVPPMPTPPQQSGGGQSASSRRLDLSGQGLDRVPAYVFDMTNLEELDVSGNALTGALPSEIGRLRNLRILDASDNRMTGIPAEIGQLQNLITLDVSNNDITGLPYEIGNLKNLKNWDLSGNNYSEQDLQVIAAQLPNTVIVK